MADVNLEFDVNLRTNQLDRDSKKIIQKIRALDRALGTLNTKGTTRLDREMSNVARTTSRLDRNVRGATSSMGNLGRQAQLTAKRFIVYNVIARFFFTLASAVSEGTKAFVSFDAELNKARQILNPLTTDFDEFTKTIFELAEAFGVTVKEVQSAQEVFIRQGKSQIQVTELTRQSLALASAAGIEFAQATEAITASLNQFTGQGLLAVDVADKFTAVSIRNAVTAEDLAQAIFRAGSAAATVGVDFNNLIGFITAAQEATRRGGRVIGTGLRTIFTRIFRAPSIAAMEELGIETRKTTGEFKNADSLIAALAARFTDLSQTQQIAIASTIAGQRQVATLLALLRNFKGAQDAANDSLNAGGEAARLTRVRQEALSVQIQKIINQFVKFGVALGNAFSGPIIDDLKGIADTMSVFGFAVDAAAPALTILSSTLTSVGVLLLAQAAGLGKVGKSYENYQSTIRRTKRELQDLAQAESKRTTALPDRELKARSRGRFAVGETKHTEARAAKATLLKQIVNFEQREVQLKNIAAAIETNINDTIKARLAITLSISAAARADKNIADAIGDREIANKKILEVQQKLRKQIRDIQPNRDNITALKEEQKLIRGNLKLELQKLKGIVGSHGEPVGKKGDAAPAAKIGLKVERDRIKVAEKLERVKSRILNLTKQQNDDDNRGFNRRARITAALEGEIGKKQRLTADLRKDANAEEVKAANLIAKARIKILGIANRRNVQTNRILTQEEQLAKTIQEQVVLEREIAELGTFIESTQLAIKQIRLDSAAATLRETATARDLTALEKQKLALIESQARRNKLITNQKERQVSLDKRAKTGFTQVGNRKGIGGAIGAGIAFNIAAEGARKVGEEGNKASEAVAQGFESAGGIALTAMLLPLGPISGILIGLQAIFAITKIIKGISGDWAKETKKIQDQVDTLTNTLRASKTEFEELKRIAGEVQLQGLSIASLNAINSKMAEMRKIFTGIPSEKFAAIEGALRKAVRANDLDALEKLRVELEQLAGVTIIKASAIDSDVINRAVELRKKVLEFAAVAKDPNLTSGLNLEHISAVFKNRLFLEASEDLEKVRKESEGAGVSLSAGFLKAANSAASYTKEVDRFELRKILDATGQVEALNESFLQTKKGFEVTASSAEGLKEAMAGNTDVFDEVNGKLKVTKFFLSDLNNAMTSTKALSGKNATIFITLSEDVDVASESFKRLADTLATQGPGLFNTEKYAKTVEVLKQSLVEGGHAVRGFKDDNGELAFKIDGIPGVIGKASSAYGFLVQILQKSGQLAGITAAAFDTFGQIQLSNARVTQLLADKYISLANSIELSAKVLGNTRSNLSAIVALNSKLAASFPEKALAVNLEQLGAIGQRAANMGAGIGIAISTLETLDERLNIIRGTLATRLTDAFFAGGDASIDFNERLKISSEIVDSFDSQIQRFDNRISNADFGTGTFVGFQAEVFSLTKQLLNIEKLSGAVLGLSSLKDKLLASDGAILAEDVKLLTKYQDTLGRGFDFKQIEIGPNMAGNRQEMAKQIDTLLQSLSSDFKKVGSKEFGRAAQALGFAIVEGMQTTLSTGGDTLAKRLDTILTENASKLSEKLREPIGKLRESLKVLRDEGTATLRQLVDGAENNLGTLADIIKRGIIPSGSTLSDILVGELVIAQEAGRVLVQRTQEGLDSLIAQKITLVALAKKQENLDEKAPQREEKIKESKKAIEAINGKILEQETGLAKEKKSQLVLASQASQVLLASISQLDAAFKNVFAAQNSVASAEVKLFQSRLGFINLEDVSVGRRLQLLGLESAAFEQIQRSITGVSKSDLGAIGAEIIRLTQDSVKKAFKDTASSEFIKTRIAELQKQFTVEQTIADFRTSNLEKELDILRKQEQAITGLGLTFIKQNSEQQKGQINAGRLTEKFFGGLSSGAQGPNTAAVQSSITDLLRNTSDDQRAAVVGQLETLKAASGEVAPGVPAAKILKEMGNIVGNALFKSPGIAIAERQEKIQGQIRDNQQTAIDIARIQLRIDAEALRAQSQLNSQVVQANAKTQTSEPGSLAQAQVSSANAANLNTSVKSLLATQDKRNDALKEEQKITDSSVVSNKKFVQATREVDTSMRKAGTSIADMAKRSVELRTQLVAADDAFITAKSAVTSASVGVQVALGNAAKAQADYNIILANAQLQNLNAVGGLQTYRDELSFVSAVYKEQITALQQVGATEQQIATLRIELAKQQLSIFEQQISNVRGNARSLLTQEGAGLQFAQAGQAAGIAASIAESIGIAPGSSATASQQEELAAAILALPIEVRQSLDKAFTSAPPGQTAGAFGINELETTILSALGGRSDATPDLLSLEKSAAQQRLIIAENSTGQLESSRQGVITAFEQLTTAREQLMEAKANKDLAQMQLDVMGVHLPEHTSLLSQISGTLVGLNAIANRTTKGTTQEFINAAGGSLTGAEVGGLLRAASREKSAMPAGAGLGVFNTSETVLTRGQAHRLRGGKTPNAANGTSVVGGDEIAGLLQDIAARVSELKQRPVTQQINVDIDSKRSVSIQGVAGLQTALQDIIGDRTGDLYTREEAKALEEVLERIINTLRETGQVSAIGT